MAELTAELVADLAIPRELEISPDGTSVVYTLLEDQAGSISDWTMQAVEGRPTELVVYPREPHGICERAHQVDLLKRVRTWYDRWLRS